MRTASYRILLGTRSLCACSLNVGTRKRKIITCGIWWSLEWDPSLLSKQVANGDKWNRRLLTMPRPALSSLAFAFLLFSWCISAVDFSRTRFEWGVSFWCLQVLAAHGSLWWTTQVQISPWMPAIAYCAYPTHVRQNFRLLWNYAHTHGRTHTRTHLQTHAHTHTYTHTLTHTHTHTPSQ